ncbi:MAG TPA: hypothetical protein VKY73_17585 [Polyangiaceae bacterium]|nr:hypothetical protein [Polyangiaceae bacterium]
MLRWTKAMVLGGALVAVGCGHPMSRKLEGTWLGDGVESFEERHIARATGWAKSLRFTFSGSELTVSIAAEEPRSGAYRIRSVRNSQVLLAVRRPDGREDLAQLELDGEHKLRWKVDEDRAIVLRREL